MGVSLQGESAKTSRERSENTEASEKCAFEQGAKCILRGCQLPKESGTHSCIERRAMQALERNVVLQEGHAAVHKDSTPQTWNPAL
jgi:hypothetical protein